MLTILIVDDHLVLVDGIKALLSSEPDLHLKYHALNGGEALNLLQNHGEVDMILLDVNLPDIDGVALCRQICHTYPEMPIIALTMHHEAGIITNMIRAGAKGYLLKNTGKTELIDAIRRVAMGNSYYSQEVTQQLLSKMTAQDTDSSKNSVNTPKITRREKEVLKLIVEEFTTEEIADHLFISSSTVISHRKSLLRKLKAKNSAGLVKAAYELKLLK